MEKLYTLRRMLFATVLLMMSAFTWAYDFEVDGICYNINEDGTSVEVTSRIGRYSGDIVIPSTVANGGTTYSVTGIGDDAFMICSSLTSISLPESITSIGSWAFYQCTSLTSISLPKGVTSIGSWVFAECISLASVTLPEGVTSIGNYTFKTCTALTSISMPEGMESIGASAFVECTSLASVSLPASMTKIEWNAFNGCTSLATVICHAEKVPEPGLTVFNNVPTSEATLYVPASALADYKAADQWKDFGTILPLEDIPAGISTIEADDSNAPYYTLDGKRVDNPTQKGIYIRNGKKVLVK